MKHREGPQELGVGSEEASLQRLSVGPHCSPPLCHPLANWWLASMGRCPPEAHRGTAGTVCVGISYQGDMGGGGYSCNNFLQCGG